MTTRAGICLTGHVGERIYTLKLARRGHLVPKALQANMFLVRHAADVMDRDGLVLPAETDFDEFLNRPEHAFIQRIWRKRAVMAIVVRGRGVPRPANIAGVITKVHVADPVASSVQIYPN